MHISQTKNPLDATAQKYFGLNFKEFGILFIILLLVLQLLVSFVAGKLIGTILSYVFWFDFILFIYVFWGLEKIFIDIDTARSDIILNQQKDIDEQKIREMDTEIKGDITSCFDPKKMIVSGILAGLFVLFSIFTLGVSGEYPFHIFNFMFGFFHGFVLYPAAYINKTVKKLRKNILYIGVLDPDGLGGYRRVGKSLLNVTIIIMMGLTIDFIILSSAMFVTSPLFKISTIISYFFAIIVITIDLFSTIFIIRNKLLELRDQRIREIGNIFSQIEKNFWKKLSVGEDISKESFAIMGINNIFEQLRRMDMWPIDIISFIKLALSIILSIGVAIIQIKIDDILHIINFFVK